MSTPEPAKGTDPAAQPSNDQPSTQPSNEDPAPQGDGDNLDAWKRHSRKWEREAGKHKSELDKANDELEKLRSAARSDQEKAVEEARKAGADEATKQWRSAYESERVRSEALRLMTGVVASPRLLLPHLNLSQVTVSDDGQVNEDALKSAVDSLIEEFPDQKVTTSSSPPGRAPSWDTGPKPKAPAGPSKPTTATGANLYRQRHKPEDQGG